MYKLNETHDPALTSWVASANNEAVDFPIQNLPFASFRRAGQDEAYRGGVAIGDQILDLASAANSGQFNGLAQQALEACSKEKLNNVMAMGTECWSALRLALSRALRSGAKEEAALNTCLVAMSDAEFTTPCHIPDYTDFYASIHHAKNIGALFRPDNPLLPNYKWVPIAYHGRSSSIAVSGQSFPRPKGQTKAPDAEAPSFGPCKRLDFELEMGTIIGSVNEIGTNIDIDDANDHVFGMCLFNDWSARDIQGWEYQPLGPFLAKNFASTMSPWIITNEALAPFRIEFTRDVSDPQPMDYLTSQTNSSFGGLDVKLEVLIETASMRSSGIEPASLATSNMKYSYWTVAQMVTHHTTGGCNIQPGDLMATGTMSGPDSSQACALIEITTGGKNPITLPNGETRTFLEDGDSVIITGHCERKGATRIGFGTSVGTVLPAI